MKTMIVLLCLMIGIHSLLQAQTSLQYPRNIQEAYLNDTRDENGKPGASYWQNKASYDMHISFYPETRLIKGSVEIEYENNSPDTLNYLIVKLYANVTKRGAMRNKPMDAEDVGNGVQLEQIQFENRNINLDSVIIKGVNAHVPVKPILPKSKCSLTIAYSYVLSKGFPGHRVGQIDEETFFVAYFFPRIAVYDDIDGWNKYPFLGVTEFYNDFSDFKVSITLPDSYIVWATGEQLNKEEVFTRTIIDRIHEAETTDKKVMIIGNGDLDKGEFTLGEEQNTFVFEVNNVTDFAFACSSNYIWESGSLVVDSLTNRRTRIDAVYHPDHTNYSKVQNWAEKTVEAMSYYYPKWSFPYSHVTVFDGLGQMEFPMITNVANSNDTVSLCQVTIHEVFHQIIPFYTGINQKKYGWIDEGWTTSGEWKIYPYLYPGEIDDFFMSDYEKNAGTEDDSPVMTISPNLSAKTYVYTSYPKPAIGFLIIKDLLGDKNFFKGLHTFIENWNGKHPTPWDMFYSFNEGSGVNLNWFWKAWYFESGYPDLAIADVSIKKHKMKVRVCMKGNMPVPINLTAEYADGSKEIIHQNISVWQSGNTETTIKFSSIKKLIKLHLGDTHIPDVNNSDNIWQR